MSGLRRKLLRALFRQRWLGPGLRKTCYKRLSALGEVPDAPFNTDFFGLEYAGNLNNNVDFNVYFYGAFEKPLLFFLRDTMRALADLNPGQGSCFYDIGANTGQHALFMSGIADQVVAFEPFAPVANKLLDNIARNGIGNIALYQTGLSDRDDQASFYAPSGRNQGVGSFDSSTRNRGNVEAGKLALAEADGFIAEHRLPAADLIKIDVEGFEKKVLKGMKNSLCQQRPVLVCEVTYDRELSFGSRQELLDCLPPDYELLCFDTRKADGSKARRRGARARKSGSYRIIDLTQWRQTGQDDLIACPREKLAAIPRSNRSGNRNPDKKA